MPLKALPAIAPVARGKATPLALTTWPRLKCRQAAARLGGTIARQQVLFSRSLIPGCAEAGSAEDDAAAAGTELGAARKSASEPGAARHCWVPCQPGEVRASTGASIQAGPMPKKPRTAPAPKPQARCLASSLLDRGSAGSCACAASGGAGGGREPASSGCSFSSKSCGGLAKDSLHCMKTATATQKTPLALRRGLWPTLAANTEEASAATVPEAASTAAALTSTRSCNAAASVKSEPGSSA
mmetsp:Transcript_102398/g.298567  ORF Transcript_102398/g.298567 Transcript_102398/m.298567 type:complete len:242 (-) Transcript_102398:261-986(-)